VNKFLKKVRKSFRYGEKGFTLIEILIVIAVLAALAAIVVPAVSGFLQKSKVAAANTEMANMKTAAIAFIAGPPDATDYTPGDDFDSDALAMTYTTSLGATLRYMQGAVEYGWYNFNGNGELIEVDVCDATTYGDTDYSGVLDLTGTDSPEFVADAGGLDQWTEP
jgi:prepilin-type N-terminal cleavage/methylation domain-containing protein